MTPDLERVARAVREAYAPYLTLIDEPWQDEMFSAIARAAVAALMEASVDALRAGNAAALSTGVLMDDTRFACERATFQAMLRAVLGEQP